MIGAIIGDIAGSRFEWDNHRSKDFELFTPKCFATDDSIMSLAVAEALMRARADFSDLSAQAVRSAACTWRLMRWVITPMMSDTTRKMTSAATSVRLSTFSVKRGAVNRKS